MEKEKIKRIYTEGTGWINIEKNIIIEYIDAEYCQLENWIVNNKLSIMRNAIKIIEWNTEIKSEDGQK